MNISDKTLNKPIHHVIERSFIMACATILVIVVSAALYFNFNNLKSSRQNAIQKTHELLSHLLIPSLSISNITEVTRLLKLASTNEEIFGVIDSSENILIPDYTKSALLKIFFNKENKINLCKDSNSVYRYIDGNKYLVNCTLLLKDNLNINSQNLGILVSFSKQRLPYFSSMIIYFIFVGTTSLVFLFIWFRRVLHKKLLKPLIILGGRIENANESESVNTLGEIGDAPSEVIVIKNAFENVMSKLHIEYEQRMQIERKSALLELAARVAHDIRSPIAVMEMNLKIMEKNTVKNDMSMFKMAIQSVRDIANNLLDRYRNNNQEVTHNFFLHDNDNNASHPILICSLVEQIISQKRHEWLGESCDLLFSFDQSVRPAWINIVPNDVKRILSNLLNNAMEACESAAKIDVSIKKMGDFLEITIADNGIGISAEKIADYLQGKSSKHQGKGLGLSGANQYMESIGGQLSVVSQIGEGSTIKLNFIMDKNPDFFPEFISLSEDTHVIVLDDDVAIQSLWFHRLQEYPVKIHLFSKYTEAMKWIDENKEILNKMIFLIDYELSESGINGFQLLKYVDAGNRGYLVTSHAEEINIQKDVNGIGVRLVPKLLASDIPIFMSK